MVVCELTGEKLPERNASFCGYACRTKNNLYCKHYRMNYKDGTNCALLQRPVDINKIRRVLGLTDNVKENGA